MSLIWRQERSALEGIGYYCCSRTILAKHIWIWKLRRKGDPEAYIVLIRLLLAVLHACPCLLLRTSLVASSFASQTPPLRQRNTTGQHRYCSSRRYRRSLSVRVQRDIKRGAHGAPFYTAWTPRCDPLCTFFPPSHHYSRDQDGFRRQAVMVESRKDDGSWTW